MMSLSLVMDRYSLIEYSINTQEKINENLAENINFIALIIFTVP